MKKKFLHELDDVEDLYQVVARERGILASVVEKDYWIMHCLWGLHQQGYEFELKGGTSLSKGYGIIERFSEDIDILIKPQIDLKVGPNHKKLAHIEARKIFFNSLSSELNIHGFDFVRDHEFDDLPNMRGAGIRGNYEVRCNDEHPLKDGVLLEVGFDQTTPNEPRDILSWVYDKASELNLEIIDNRALAVKCYLPEYTFVEKLQTISTKFRLQQINNDFPKNFIRNYYDVYQLLMQTRVLEFLGSDAYLEHKNKRFRSLDQVNLTINDAFLLNDENIFHIYQNEYLKKSALYYGNQPEFFEIMNVIKKNLLFM